jgi:transposase
MTIAVDQLPDDPAVLKQLLVEVIEQHAAAELDAERRLAQIREEAARQLEAERAARQAAIDEAVKAAVAAILRRYYGPRAEKFDPRQLLLFGQQIEQALLDPSSIEDESGEKLLTRRVRNRHKHGRQRLPDHLERIEIEHDLTDKACPACGNERCRIGQESSEQLEYFPASFKVLRHIHYKYACAQCDHDGFNPNIEMAKKPTQPIDKGLPGPSLLAHVITSKLGDASSRDSRCMWPAALCVPGCELQATS